MTDVPTFTPPRLAPPADGVAVGELADIATLRAQQTQPMDIGQSIWLSAAILLALAAGIYMAEFWED